jgi:hypothetical protein
MAQSSINRCHWRSYPRGCWNGAACAAVNFSRQGQNTIGSNGRSYLEGYVSQNWNTIEASLVETAKRLVVLGFVLSGDGVTYPKASEERHV